MIPKYIKGSHILHAIEHLRHNPVPDKREARKFHILHDGTCFPAKYVIALAHEFATGEMLDHKTFSGGDESNRFLRNLGFEVVQLPLDPSDARSSSKESCHA